MKPPNTNLSRNTQIVWQFRTRYDCCSDNAIEATQLYGRSFEKCKVITDNELQNYSK